MAVDITLQTISSLTNQTSAISALNGNTAAITDAFTDALSRSGGSPNQMEANLDMNSNRILNLPAPVGLSDPMRMQDFTTPAQITLINSSVPALYPVSAYGARGDGVTDDTTAIQNAIAAAAANGGGTVLFNAATYIVSSTITVTSSHVKLLGVGCDATHSNAGAGTIATRIKWNGATSATTAVIYYETNVSSSLHIFDCALEGVAIDGNSKAGYGLRITSVNSSKFEHISVSGCTTHCYFLDCLNNAQITSDWTDNQEDKFINCAFVATGSVNGFFLSGSSVSPGGNTSFCTFQNCTGWVVNGAGYLLDNADNNTFIICHSFVTGTGSTFDCRGTTATSLGGECNHFVGCSWAKFTIRGTDSGFLVASQNNYIISFDLLNGSPAPVLGTGALFNGPVAGFAVGSSALTTWTPVVTASAGTITSYTVNNANYRLIGKTILFATSITVTNIGTATGTLRVTFPPLDFSIAGGHFPSSVVFPGINLTHGTSLTGWVQNNTTFNVAKYDGSFPVVNGDQISISGWYIID